MNRIGQGISIVITAYKAHNFISECLDSILCQHNIDFSKIEVLVGVDGCKETLNKLKEIKDKYNQIRLKVVYFKNNRGTYITSNTLVTLTRYNNIIRFDSDDIMYPNMINTIMSQNEHYNVIRFNYHDFFDNNINNKRLYKTVGTGVFFITKQLFMLVGGFEDWACSADAELQNRLECIQREIRLKEPLFLRRVHNDSLTMNKETGWFTEKRKEINTHIYDNVNNATLRIEMPINKNYKIMFDLQSYWDNRYKTGGNSGAGSYGQEAQIKADYINEVIRKYSIQTIQEYGVGDGHNMSMYYGYKQFNGYDIAPHSIELCKTNLLVNHAKCRFTSDITKVDKNADLALNLDVLLHQVEDKDYYDLLNLIFKANHMYILLYTPDREESPKSAAHVRYRKVQDDVARLYPEHKLIDKKMVNITEEKYFLLYKL